MDERRRARRAWLRLMAAGALGAGGASGFIGRALAKGDLPNVQALHRVDGSALVNGKPAAAGTPVALGDKVSTGPGSQALVVMKGDAFLLRAQTTVELRGKTGVLEEVAITAGKVLSVFAPKPVSIQAVNATVGIRGTGAYFEVEGRSVYFCLCYGEADITGPGMAQARNVKTTHHESPLLIDADAAGLRITPGPFRNHTDDELILLESLVGREPPFTRGGQYPANKY